MRSLTRLISRPPFLFVMAAALSLLLSAWRMATVDVINPDGICYLQSAATVWQQHTLAMHLCDQSGWPFYQIVIGSLSVISGLSIPASANLLNALLSLMSVMMFIVIVRFLTPRVRVHWLAAGTILLAHHFNAFRADVIRDHGYWAFYLLSLYLLLRYFSTPRVMLALLWAASLVMATLFRLEGAIFLLLLPWIVFLMPGVTFRARTGAFLWLNSLLLLIVVLIGGWLLRHPGHSLGRLDYLVFELTHGWQVLAAHWHQASLTLGQSVLSIYSARDASLVLGIAMAGYYIVGLMDAMTFGYFVLVVYAFCCRRTDMPLMNRRVMLAYVLINLLITSLFLAQNFFLARRYSMALALTLILWVPFALEDLVHRWKKRRWPLLLAVFLVVVCSFGGIFHFGTSRVYLREAGDWLAAHAAPHAKIYSNDIVLLYYTRHFGNDIFNQRPEFKTLEKNGKWAQYDWLAVRLAHHEKVNIRRRPVKVFYNQHNVEVRIYSVRRDRKS